MQEISFDEGVEQILKQEKRYNRDAYAFVRDALNHTQKVAHREAKAGVRRKEQHVSGQQLLEGIRQMALEQFGPMAITVLEEWGVRSCRDFGEIVFIMLAQKILKKTDEDSRTDFDNGYNFLDAFRKPFLPKGKQSRSVAVEKPARA